MRLRGKLSALLAVLLIGPAWPLHAGAAGGMSSPSTGSVGSNGLFLACRSGSSGSATDYYDQQNALKVWDCGAGRRPHKGVDILGPSRRPGADPVFAAAAGEVWTAERGNGLGWRVVLRHGQNVGGNGLFTYSIYGHLGDCATGRSFIAPEIVPGARISAGQHIGWQGDDSFPSGCAGGSHVHWEVRVSQTDVSNVFLATAASPNFYTGLALTADDPLPATSVSAAPSGAVPTPPPSTSPPSTTPPPTGSPGPGPSPGPTPLPTEPPNPLQFLIDIFLAILRWLGISPDGLPLEAAPGAPAGATLGAGADGSEVLVLESPGTSGLATAPAPRPAPVRVGPGGIDRTWWSPPPVWPEATPPRAAPGP